MRDVFALLPYDTILHVFDKVMVALTLIARTWPFETYSGLCI